MKLKKKILDFLLKKNAGRENKCHILASVIFEWMEANKNIQENGSIVFHPRTNAPIENPYLKIRDNAEKKILSKDFIAVNSKEIWKNIENLEDFLEKS